MKTIKLTEKELTRLIKESFNSNSKNDAAKLRKLRVLENTLEILWSQMEECDILPPRDCPYDNYETPIELAFDHFYRELKMKIASIKNNKTYLYDDF